MSDLDKGPKIEASEKPLNKPKSKGGESFYDSFVDTIKDAYQNIKIKMNSDDYERKIGEELQKPLNQKEVDKFNKGNPFYNPKDKK